LPRGTSSSAGNSSSTAIMSICSGDKPFFPMAGL
jgi:hypothetical protein